MDLMETVELNADHATRYAHEFSGGQRQRIGIARALAVDPKFIVCDEPVSALDVSIQAQILNMLVEIQKTSGISLLFISHDIGVIRFISDRIGVMYLGTLVEEADAEVFLKILCIRIPKHCLLPHRIHMLCEGKEIFCGGAASSHR